MTFVSVCPYPRLRITSGVMWYDMKYDWLNKFYTFYMVAVVGIDIRHGLIIKVHHRNLPNKSKLVLCKPWIHINNHLKLLYISNKMECFNYKGPCGICRRIHIKTFQEELAWATDKRLPAISNIMLFNKTVVPLRKWRIIHCKFICIAMWSLVMYSNCFVIRMLLTDAAWFHMFYV